MWGFKSLWGPRRLKSRGKSGRRNPSLSASFGFAHVLFGSLMFAEALVGHGVRASVKIRKHSLEVSRTELSGVSTGFFGMSDLILT